MIECRRREDWPTRLTEAVLARSGMEFRYGYHDCCMGAAYLVAAMCGVDPAARWRGYATARGADFRLTRFGGVAGLAGAAAADHGWQEIVPAFAGRGDLVVIEAPRGTALGIVDSSGRHVLVADRVGWALLDKAMAQRAWRLP